jgi:DNA-binding MarR family transcriptional regulator
MDDANYTGDVDRMVKRGYIRTAPDPNDGRRLVLQLTGDGRAVIEGNLAAALQASESTLEPLTSGERMMFIELLRKIT